MASRSLRLVLLCLTTLLLCACALYVGVYSTACYRAQKSKELLARVGQLQVAQTTEGEVRKLAANFGGKYFPPEEATQNSLPQPAYYRTEMASPYVSIGDSTFTLPGLRVWFIVARLDVEMVDL